MDRIDSGQKAWQGSSHVYQDAPEINRSYIDSAKKEVSETRGTWRGRSYSINARSGEFGNRYPIADSLW